MNPRRLIHWFWLKLWVTAARRMRCTALISPASGVSTKKVSACPKVAGADVITGRDPRNRYGGE